MNHITVAGYSLCKRPAGQTDSWPPGEFAVPLALAPADADCPECLHLQDKDAPATDGQSDAGRRSLFRDGHDTTTSQLLEYIALVNPAVSAVLSAARALDINPHGDRAVRECLLQLHAECEEYRGQLMAIQEHQVRPVAALPTLGDPK